MFSSCYVSAVQRKIPKTNVLHVLYFLCFATSWISREYLVFLVGVLFSFCLLLFFLDFGFLVVFYFSMKPYILCAAGVITIYVYIYIRTCNVYHMHTWATHWQHIYVYIIRNVLQCFAPIASPGWLPAESGNQFPLTTKADDAQAILRQGRLSPELFQVTGNPKFSQGLNFSKNSIL